MKKLLLNIFVFASVALLNSCGTPAVDIFTAQRMIAINDDGSPHKYPVESGDVLISANDYNYSNQVDEIIESIKNSGRTNILIFGFG